ncbi:putative signal transduction histidine kinase [Runella slithyformis DSM 19594]|uniref:Signal transduction histidine kinase n=2 Tax=Runella TaxID=105 RepID=A0A7U3ZKP8_RUNSL|nr:putative signal transduction histidine kinase [Runella slithyformis DSM 19594]
MQTHRLFYWPHSLLLSVRRDLRYKKGEIRLFCDSNPSINRLLSLQMNVFPIEPSMKIQINRVEVITWSVSALLILLLNTNLKTGEIRWDWVIVIILSSFLIGSIQGYLMPRLMQRAADWTVQKMLGVYALCNVVTALTIGSAVMFSMQIIQGGHYSLNAYISSGMIYILMTFAFTSVYMIRAVVDRWRVSLLKEQQLSQALLKAEYDTLKNQVNPHFLFNSLNILSALIPEDPENAVNLVERLSKVFRYNLQNNDRISVDLGTELKIVEAYLFIHKMRFGDNLSYQIEVPKDQWPQQIVTQGLLTLVENAVKHNECSSEKPLKVEVYVGDRGVTVRNNFQPKNKQFLESTGIGLKNLKSRYALLTSRKVEVTGNARFFEVTIPFV